MTLLKRSLRAALCTLFIGLSVPALANEDCSRHFAGGQAPQLTNPKLGVKTRMLCYEAFALLHSGVSRTPLWVAEHLTKASLDRARGRKRVCNFHPEPRLPRNERSELEDFARSGYDRGHMAPYGDMPSGEAGEESCSLANNVPQHPELNQEVWERIETATRNLASRRGSLHVVTGPVFQGADVAMLNRRMMIPTHVYKAVYDEVTEEGGAYYAINAAGNQFKTMSIAELEATIGINVFPAMPAQAKMRLMNLPQPGKPRFEANERTPAGRDFAAPDGAMDAAKSVVRGLWNLAK